MSTRVLCAFAGLSIAVTAAGLQGMLIGAVDPNATSWLLVPLVLVAIGAGVAGYRFYLSVFVS